MSELSFDGRKKPHQTVVVMLGGQHVDIMFRLIKLFKMRVFEQIRFLNNFFEQLKGKKRTWANPMSSKQRKSFYDNDNSAFRFS